MPVLVVVVVVGGWWMVAEAGLAQAIVHVMVSTPLTASSTTCAMCLKPACPTQPLCPVPSVNCMQGDDRVSTCYGPLCNIDDLWDVGGGRAAQH